jgi:hypothetical protein
MILQVYIRSRPLDLHVMRFNVQCALKPSFSQLAWL